MPNPLDGQRRCALCGNQLDFYEIRFMTDNPPITVARCPVCGPYQLEEGIESTLDSDSTNEREHSLAWIIRDLPADEKSPIYCDTVDELIRRGLAREPSPSGKARLLLLEIKRLSTWFGNHVNLQASRMWPLVKARGVPEFHALLAELVNRGWISRKLHLTDFTGALTWEGWAQVEPISGVAAKTVFVAMKFKEMDSVYEAIQAAIMGVGLIPLRIDKEHFQETVNERMLTEIHSAEFMIADFTGGSQGVYFEAGYALALNKKIVWLCREDQRKDVHFDTRQYPHIFWTSLPDLSRQLEEKLKYLAISARTTGQ